MVLAGSARLSTTGASHLLHGGVLARVGPSIRRKLVAGPEGATVLVIGAVAGRAYAVAAATA